MILQLPSSFVGRLEAVFQRPTGMIFKHAGFPPFQATKALGQLLDIAFFSSTAMEEGKPARFSFALSDNSIEMRAYKFDPPKPQSIPCGIVAEGRRLNGAVIT